MVVVLQATFKGWMEIMYDAIDSRDVSRTIFCIWVKFIKHSYVIVRRSGVMVRALDSWFSRSRVRISAVPLSGNNLGQVVHTHVPLSPSTSVKGRWCPAAGKVTVGQATHCTSGFMDDVVFAPKPRLLDVAAQLNRSAHAALVLAINCAQ